MSSEDSRADLPKPIPEESPALDGDTSSFDTPEERLTRELDETAGEVTARLDDLQEELPPPSLRVDAPPPETEASDATPEPGVQPPLLPVTSAGGTGTTPPQKTFIPEGSDDDRLMAGLAWLSMVILQLPVVSVIQLLSPNNRDREFQRHHAVTSLLFYVAAIAYEIVAAVAFTILTIVTAGLCALCLWVVFFVPHVLGLYFAYQAYMGKRVELPILSDFGRKQGWM